MDLLRSLPLGLYLEQPITWLHRLDPRIKLAWLLSFLLAIIWSSIPYRLGLMGLLIGIALLAVFPGEHCVSNWAMCCCLEVCFL
jgi:energy-coupling factor transport system permease protein